MRLLFKNTFSIIPHSKNSLFAKLFSLLFFGVLLDPSVSEAQCTSSSGTADVRVVTGSSDDATQQLVSPYTMTTGGSGLALMTTANYVGLRFPTVNIPQGATITSAYIEFTASATAAMALNPITIYGSDTTSTVGFTTTARDMKNRGRTGNPHHGHQGTGQAARLIKRRVSLPLCNKLSIEGIGSPTIIWDLFLNQQQVQIRALPIP